MTLMATDTNREYVLTWEGGDSYTLTEAKALRILKSWTGRGVLTGSFARGEVRFEDNFGRKATMRRA